MNINNIFYDYYFLTSYFTRLKENKIPRAKQMQ